MESSIWSPSAVGPVVGRGLRLFALNGTDVLGENIGKLLAYPLSAHEEHEFEDGEHKARACLQLGFPNRQKIDSRLQNGGQP